MHCCAWVLFVADSIFPDAPKKFDQILFISPKSKTLKRQSLMWKSAHSTIAWERAEEMGSTFQGWDHGWYRNAGLQWRSAERFEYNSVGRDKNICPGNRMWMPSRGNAPGTYNAPRIEYYGALIVVTRHIRVRNSISFVEPLFSSSLPYGEAK